MYATDFIYDGEYLSDYNFVICSIDSSGGVSEISAGSEITFNQTALNSGNKHSLTSTKYNTCVSATFDICKDPDYHKNIEITESEHREIIRWLNRNTFNKFGFRTGYVRDCYYNASFNITNIYIDDVLCGFRLHMTTNMPYGYGEEVVTTLSVTNTLQSFNIENLSDEIGFVNPNLTILVGDSSGDLVITNKTYLGDEPMIIKNCIPNETIHIDCDNQIIYSNMSSHNISNDFNYRFFKLGRSYKSGTNKIEVSLPCYIDIKYNPIIKNIN